MYIHLIDSLHIYIYCKSCTYTHLRILFLDVIYSIYNYSVNNHY